MPPKKNRFRRKFNNQKFNKNTYGQTSKKIEYRHRDQLAEVEVGITEFISKLDGFSGIIKSRFSDFQVNEIDLDGKVAILTDTSIPKDFNKPKSADQKFEATEDSPLETIPQTIWANIFKIASGESTDEIRLAADELSKDERAKVHHCIKDAFKEKITVDTKNEDGKKFMIFKKHDTKDRKDFRQKWPEDKPEYVHFLVYKERTDTIDASLSISDCLRISASNFNYAGVKDRRAKTTQWFSVRKVEPWKLITKTRNLRAIHIGNITFKDRPLKLGQLLGNKFRIALRNVIGDDELIIKALNGLKENGFINYYGLQRFGNDKEAPTFSIGNQLLLGNWKDACAIILKPLKSDEPTFDTTKAKKVFAETGDAGKALKEFEENRNKCIEYKLLEGLSQNHSNDYVTALEVIPRNIRLLYVHAFQSFIWNHAVSKRIAEFGLKPVAGDLVLVKEERLETGEIQKIEEDEEIRKIEKTEANKKTEETEENQKNLDPEEKQRVEESEENEKSEETEENEKSGGAEEIEDEEEGESKVKQEVKVLTAEDCEDYTIYDVVLPLPGYDVIYPENLRLFYQEQLEKYGLTLDMAKKSVQTYNLSGNYRKILGKVENLSWKITHYDDPTCNLIQSDWEELRQYEGPKYKPDGKYKALILEFNLNSSSYATMVLREILKTDTSSSEHAKMNDYHNETKTTDETTTEIQFAQEENLLDNKEQYEAFKNNIFGDESSCSKRKLKEGDDGSSGKIARTD